MFFKKNIYFSYYTDIHKTVLGFAMLLVPCVSNDGNKNPVKNGWCFCISTYTGDKKRKRAMTFPETSKPTKNM
jgi:hypothetical protein